jgi:hypothetical protein
MLEYLHPGKNSLILLSKKEQLKMKKVKLNINFLSAAGTVFGYFAVLFTRETVSATVRPVPFFPRR